MLHLAAVLLHLRGENMTPDVPRSGAEAERNTVLAFLQFLDQFNSGQDAACWNDLKPNIAETRNFTR